MDFFLDQTNLIILFTAVASGIMLLLPNILKGGKAVSVSDAVLLANQKQGVFVDVRSPDAFKTGSIPQARNLPASDIQAKLSSLPKDKPIIVVCDQGRESTRVAGSLRKQGYDQAVGLEGGLRSWSQAGMPLSKKH